ncbi:type IV pilus modification protein PilV [Variovorax sp. PBL-H6]|uniref:type IV pilus modification PilV family protein n=1 Tax=Variovorax sp. PBL-H6 TaxID=434009 RepID=UPI001319497B|nr:prepilin-type N-terminal cleavage/methylation domain-containing protein [Variovorax sp. PBL-H6]VTU39101.1 type IV pilus modification protein PilV [Variovorax sp. PBL-H6]
MKGANRARGIALIEVLVALLIFMLGVLGLLGMQSTLTKSQTDSKIRADAAYLASEVVGRMWTDINNLTGYEGDTSCTAASCTEWRSKIGQILPGGGAVITVDEGTGDVSVTVTWTVPGGETHKFVTQTTIAAKTAS